MRNRPSISSPPQFKPQLRHYHRPSRRSPANWQEWADGERVKSRRKPRLVRLILIASVVLLIAGAVLARIGFLSSFNPS